MQFRDFEEAMLPLSTACLAGRVLVMTIMLLACVTGAAYPLTTSPQWAVEGELAFANLGTWVSTAGDVNGDGYSDAIVLAGGLAFVYHGSASGLETTPAWTAQSSPAGYYSQAGTAGDVNGDGFFDVIIGAPEYSDGQSFEGLAIVYLGSASGLSSTPAWTVESNQASSEFGTSVGTAGDVNGDGYADVIVGARYFDDGQVNEGGAFLYHGSASGLATTPATTLQSNVQGAYFGSSVGTAGDVNSDGYADVIVGAPLYTNGQGGEGAAFVYLGASGGTATTSAWSTESNQAGAALGNAVGTAGDVNSDGYADVVVGAYQYDNGQNNEGRAMVFHGSGTGLAATPAWTVELNQGQFGYSVGTAGDVTGDGYADVIVGGTFYANGQAQEGIAAVFQGSSTGLSTTPIWSTEGDQIAAELGRSVGTAGDTNGDGLSDVIVGVPYYDGGLEDEGSARVFHGRSSGLGTATFFTFPDVVLPANAAFGHSVGSGDVNGNGYSDIVVGAPGYDSNRGRAFVYFEGSNPDLDLQGAQAGARFGSSVACAGDVNGDGYAVIIVGAPQYDNGQNDEGRAFVYLGSDFFELPLIPSWTAEGNRDLANFGVSVATAGDVNGDGFSDVIIGEYYDGGIPGTWPWRAYVYLGSWLGLASSPAWSVGDSIPSSPSVSFKLNVTTAGDVNGDGFSDVMVGMTGFGVPSELGTPPGRVFVYLGSAAGLEVVPAWTADGQAGSELLGVSVATAGDVNGDGFSDVVIGSPLHTVFAYHGSADGLAETPAWSVGSGSYVATAGDLDADGYSDVIVGEPSYTDGQFSEGRVLAYHGSASGLLTIPSWTLDGQLSNAELGTALSTAGDLTGDGYADIILGGPRYTYNGAVGTGLVFIASGGGGGVVSRSPLQMRTQTSTLVSLLGLVDSHSSVRLILGECNTAAGRGRVRLQAEVKPVGVPFDGTGLITGPATDTGPGFNNSVALNHLVTGLPPGTAHHWRLRILGDSPFFPRSIWFSPPGNAPSETDFRTPSLTTSVEETSPSPSRPHLAAAPNPFTSATRFLYVLPEGGMCRLSFYDVRGRRVALLVEGVQPAGRYTVAWDGRDGRGRDLPGGIYFLRLEAENYAETRKVVIAR